MSHPPYDRGVPTLSHWQIGRVMSGSLRSVQSDTWALGPLRKSAGRGVKCPNLSLFIVQKSNVAQLTAIVTHA
jgi:hypothetical protein